MICARDDDCNDLLQIHSTDIARALYHSSSLKFGSFRLKSGNRSPYYFDLSWLLSSPKDFCCVRDSIVSSIREISTKDEIAKLASIELKGTLILPSVACKLGLPCVAVRKERKKYGSTGRVCGGTVGKGERILFFDDVISEGTSKLEGIRPLEEMGALIQHVVVVVDREHGGRETLERLGYRVHSLATISELTTHLHKSKSITEEQTEAVLNHVERVKRKR